MLVGVNSALKLLLIILKPRFKIEKSSFYKNCSKESNLNYLFHNLLSQVKGKKDNQAVQFEFEFTSYRSLEVHFINILFFALLSLLTLIRAAGGVYEFRNFERYNSIMPLVTKNVKINRHFHTFRAAWGPI